MQLGLGLGLGSKFAGGGVGQGDESSVQTATVYGPYTFTGSDGGYAGFTTVQILHPNNMAVGPAGIGTHVRVTLEFQAFSNTAVMSACYWGESPAGNAPDFTATRKQITFGGGNASIAGDGTTLIYVSDWVALNEDYDEAAIHAFAAQFNGTGTVTLARELAAAGGDVMFYKAGADAATLDKSGYTLQITNSPVLVKTVEIATGAP